MTKICDNANHRNNNKDIDFKTRIIKKIHPSNENYDFIAKLFKEMEKQDKNNK
jgi:hypothetical protein